MYCEVIYTCISRTGKKRKMNQDNFVIGKICRNADDREDFYCSHDSMKIDKITVLGVFDGLGGCQHGEIAAYIAAKNAAQTEWSGDIKQQLNRYIDKTNDEICNYIKDNSLSSMGTTAAITVIGKKMFFCNIGDSKIFKFSNGKLIQLSFDHLGTSFGGRKPQLTQCLGIPKNELTLEPYIISDSYKKGDIYIMCSDGLSDVVDKEEMRNIIKENNFENICSELLTAALDNGGTDDISIIILKIKSKRLINFKN